jgi:hypothetical protein
MWPCDMEKNFWGPPVHPLIPLIQTLPSDQSVQRLPQRLVTWSHLRTKLLVSRRPMSAKCRRMRTSKKSRGLDDDTHELSFDAWIHMNSIFKAHIFPGPSWPIHLNHPNQSVSHRNQPWRLQSRMIISKLRGTNSTSSATSLAIGLSRFVQKGGYVSLKSNWYIHIIYIYTYTHIYIYTHILYIYTHILIYIYISIW